MTAISEDILTKVSTEAASEFVQSFYKALQSARATISSFYAPTTASIILNGNVVADGPAVQEIFMNQMPPSHYEIQSYDCQVINPNYPTTAGVPTDAAGRPLGGTAAARNMSILVIVSGYVRFGDGRESLDSPNRGFSETFVLVPSPPSDGGLKAKAARHWLIQSQNFRIVV